MADISPELENTLRQVFKHFNRFMLLMWRLGLGKWINIWPDKGGRILVLVHTGRKTGIRRRTPVNYAIVEGELYCIAGFGKVSDWYRNIMAKPQVVIWLPDERWMGVAEDVTDCPEHIDLMRAVLIGSGFAAELFGLQPKTMSDEEIQEITANYRLIHIRRTQALVGPGGPGDLVWVWPLAAVLLLPLFFLLRRRRS